MAIPTVAVFVRLYEQDGEPSPRSIIRAQLQGLQVYQGHILPEVTEAMTDEFGYATLHLWPNVLGPVPSTYKFTIVDEATNKSYRFYAVVPNYDLYLDQLTPVDPTGVNPLDPNQPPLPGAPGADGAAATVTVGTTQTVAADQLADVDNAGTPNAAILNFRIPRGPKGEKGDTGLNGTGTMVVGAVNTLPSGSAATVTNVGTDDRAILNFGIPQGPAGPPGTSTGGGTAASPEVFYPLYAWEGTTAPAGPDNSGAVVLSAALLTGYNSTIQNAALGNKRMAASNYLVSQMGTAQRLTLTRDGASVLVAYYAGSMGVLNDGVNIGLSLAPFSSIDAIAAADIHTGVWQAVLAGGTSYASTMTLTVGPAASGKHLTLTADTAPGQGFAPTFTLIVPRSADGL